MLLLLGLEDAGGKPREGGDLQQLLFSENFSCIRIEEDASLPIPDFLPDEAGSKD